MTTVPPSGQDWTNSERAELRRLEKLCDASDRWTFECSQTDVGDPWCIIYDPEECRIVLHIARIERHYLVVWPGRNHTARTTIMAVAVEMALEGLQVRSRRAG
jgi:hypothetical protein